ncbi:ATP-binding cassette domain-containing protein [Gammaproteobacteria bacterium]|nr:ATP-binding cassette domain-containing protein [Gammaproteobacteria bacterium]
MLSFNNLSLRRGSNLLFEQVSFTIHKDNKVGLVGANGTGKTSLFKMIQGEFESDEGDYKHPPDLKMAHLAQEVPETDEEALDYVMGGDENLVKIQNAILEAQTKEDYGSLGELHAQFEDHDGFTAKSRAEKLLVGLGFSEDEFNKPLKDFSGGWRVRLNLARTLMQPADLLLLDEPTNHLDLDAIIWLGNWIKSFRGALVLISHDREFLDECVGFIAHIHGGTIELYKGNYSQFEIRKAAKLAELESNYTKQQREISHMQDFVRRFKAKATKARQAQSRIKALERMELIAPAHIDSPFQFRIPETDKISNPLIILEDADLGYTDSVVRDVKIAFRPGDRIGLLGVNGAGKSTLVKSLKGDLPLLNGQKIEGKNLKVGYFSQHQVDDLNLQKSPIDQLQAVDEKASESEIRSFLGGFNFRGDKAKGSIEHFSGGEKARLALSIIAFQKPNLLLMDEPTNHLDMDMRQALTVALQDFGGAILLISHDRHLLANTVDEFLIINEGNLSSFKGDLEDYRKTVLKGSSGKEIAKKEKSEILPKLSKQEIKEIKNKIIIHEKTLKRLQRKLSETEDTLNSPESYDSDEGPDLHSLLRDQANLTSEIELNEQEWLELNERLEGRSL